MKAFLLHPDRDVDWKTGLEDPDLVRDLGLDTLLDAMAGDDALVRDVAGHALLNSLGEPGTIIYRQQILRDWLDHRDVLIEIYNLAAETIAGERRIWPGFLRSPDSIMYRSVQAMDLFLGQLRKLRTIADDHAADVHSPGLTRFFRMLRAELDDAYFATIEDHLRRLKFKNGVLVSIELGTGCKNTGYILRRPHPKPGWRVRLTGDRNPSFTYRIPDRDEAGGRALAEIRARGINLAADALARSSDHILSFFTMLCRELAFYVGCLNLQARLSGKGEPLCFPAPLPAGRPVLTCRGLYDTCLSLRRDERVAGNDVDADGVPLIVITGANEGGKSTFLRSAGLAQLMMQAGMFVSATSFTADVSHRLFTHYRREEDAEMESGKLDEELARISAIADQAGPGSIVLFNESFAATNEREGSQIARQVVHALLDCDIKVLIVTHLYDLADGLHREHTDDALFLRAGREADGTRTFRLQVGQPLPTSFGADLYQQVFGAPPRS
ncbi:MutS-related protein [Actinoallomurus acaciae]|uniref:DNA mismatch repair proteins mutS family domain-containing protein n=1 Tax=Actinoallomurus acaciae TaxID=502577 RepID=A0ABV5YAN9_9ACTN